MQRHRYDRANFSAASRPWDKGGGGGHPDPEICRGQSPKHFFRPFGPQFGLKMRGAPGLSPRSAAEFDWLKRLKRWLCSHLGSRHSTRVRCSRRVQGDIWVWTDRFFVSKPDQNSGAVRVQGRDHSMYNHNSTIFRWHWCQLNCMHAYIVSFEVRICLLTVHFFFLAQNGAIASIMNNIRYKVLEEAQFCDFCASSLAIVFGNCVRTLHRV